MQTSSSRCGFTSLDTIQRVILGVKIIEVSEESPSDNSANLSNITGSIHIMELAFILGSSLHDLMNFEWSDDDFQVADFITTLWTNFAKSGYFVIILSYEVSGIRLKRN